jgi:hypothetical protein
MRFELKDGKIQIDVYDVLEALTGPERIELVTKLACEGDVVKHVAEQILDGMTEEGYSSGRVIGAQATPFLGLDWACREVAKRSGEVAKAEIERLESALAASEKRYRDVLDESMNRVGRGY